jgi:alpha-ketoglutarate-dependent dioxygenase FTO
MGKKHKKRPRERTARPSPTHSRTSLKHTRQNVTLPLSFPPNLPVPKRTFLRNETPYEEAFQAALETSYEGFAVDLPSDQKQKDIFPHKAIEHALETLEMYGFFRTDVTQPFGLGTQCAKTYVTRCLLGEKGTTYRYLGLRMFAYPWDDGKLKSSEELQAAVRTIRRLNGNLKERTEHHLHVLDQKRTSRGAEPTRGRASFDIALINRMQNSTHLKKEPMIGDGRCSVSWHADSSLEHFSTIAVYHTIQHTEKETSNGSWSVALRVAHHSEGPTASLRGGNVESSIVNETPPIAVSLPSGSAYYLLDDFNHHHQHAVLATGGDAGIRFSSTHRLLRESHNVSHLLDRCRVVCSGFHKKGPKVWRPEQLLLTEMETEWIRQFYIQGQRHHNALWEAWGESMRSLLGYWSKLESRTKHVIDLLHTAAEGRCHSQKINRSDGDSVPSRRERKSREKRKKAASVVEEIVARREDAENASALEQIYEPFAALLEDRAEMRELWAQREKDGVFLELDPSNRPMHVPFEFGVEMDNDERDSGFSPLQGSPTHIRELASSVRAWGRVYDTRDEKHLPHCSEGELLPAGATAHDMPVEWDGWKDRSFGLEMQSPWAELLLDGKKKVETRSYDLPPALLGKRIEILQSRKGTPGQSSIENIATVDDPAASEPLIRRIGWCTFKRTVRYQDKQCFEADEDVHLVKPDSGFAWKDGATLYGWAVDKTGRYSDMAESSSNRSTTLIRRKRSLFELQSFEKSARCHH